MKSITLIELLIVTAILIMLVLSAWVILQELGETPPPFILFY